MTADNPNETQVQENWLSMILRLVKNKYIRFVFLLLLLGFAVVQISMHYHDLATRVLNFDINWTLIILAFLLTCLATIVGIFCWGLIMSGMGFEIKWIKISQIQVYSSLAKYIPGFIWQVAGKTYMSHEAGIPSSMAVIGFGLEVTLTLFVGMAIFFFTAPFTSGRGWFQIYDNFLWKATGLIFFFLLMGIPILCKYFFKKLFQKHDVRVRVLRWYLTLVLILFGWFLLSAACQLSILALGVSDLNFVDSVLAVSGSYVAGLVFFFAPSGIVIRETILVMLLPDVIDRSLGILLSVILRMETINADFLLGLVILIISAISRGLSGDNSKLSRT